MEGGKDWDYFKKIMGRGSPLCSYPAHDRDIEKMFMA